MIKLENTVPPSAEQWEAIIRGMRNPKNSWDRSDSERGCTISDSDHEIVYCKDCEYFCDSCFAGGELIIGPNDHTLMMSLAKGGPVHAKYRRMIPVYVDIIAPLYWWKEFDTYKVGTVANSCSTMHKIHAKEFELDDFSHDRLDQIGTNCLEVIIRYLNECRTRFNETKDRAYWDYMIQSLPTSYNQKRTVMLNYEVLHNIYISRKNHKLPEWHEVCAWIESLPYSEIITCEEVLEDAE